MSQLVLYRAIASPPVRSVMMLSDILGLQMEYRDVDLFQFKHKSEEYRKLNPMGTVPVLQDGDFILSESHAILKYLTTSYGGENRERLYPSEARAQARVDQCLYFNSGYFFPRMGSVAMPALFHGITTPSPKQLADIEEAYGVVEAYLRARRFVAADALTLADLAVGATATATALIRDIDGNRYPRMTEWLSELDEMPFFKDINAKGVYLLKKFIAKAKERSQSKSQS